MFVHTVFFYVKISTPHNDEQTFSSLPGNASKRMQDRIEKHNIKIHQKKTVFLVILD